MAGQPGGFLAHRKGLPPRAPDGEKGPQPAVLYAGPWLLAYRVREADAEGLFAVVRYPGVEEHRMGPRFDAPLGEHPLHGRGLEPYAFHEVMEALPDAYAPRRWVVTFRDETLEVTAGVAVVVSRGLAAATGWATLRAVVPDGQ